MLNVILHSAPQMSTSCSYNKIVSVAFHTVEFPDVSIRHGDGITSVESCNAAHKC